MQSDLECTFFAPCDGRESSKHLPAEGQLSRQLYAQKPQLMVHLVLWQLKNYAPWNYRGISVCFDHCVWCIENVLTVAKASGTAASVPNGFHIASCFLVQLATREKC